MTKHGTKIKETHVPLSFNALAEDIPWLDEARRKVTRGEFLRELLHQVATTWQSLDKEKEEEHDSTRTN